MDTSSTSHYPDAPHELMRSVSLQPSLPEPMRRAATVAIQSRLGDFLPPGLDLAREPLLALDEETALRPEVAIFRNPGPAPEAVVMTATGHDRNVALKLAAYRRYGASDVVVISPDTRRATVHRSHGAVEVATSGMIDVAGAKVNLDEIWTATSRHA